MNIDDERSRIFGELHRLVFTDSVHIKHYTALLGCMKSCRNLMELVALTLEKPYGKREAIDTAQNVRMYLQVLEAHLNDPWVTQINDSKGGKK